MVCTESVVPMMIVFLFAALEDDVVVDDVVVVDIAVDDVVDDELVLAVP